MGFDFRMYRVGRGESVTSNGPPHEADLTHAPAAISRPGHLPQWFHLRKCKFSNMREFHCGQLVHCDFDRNDLLLDASLRDLTASVAGLGWLMTLYS